MFVGHVVGTVDGVIQAMDEAVSTILQRTQKQLIGHSYASITHPLDIAKSRIFVAALQNQSGPVRLRKRYVAGEGGIVTLDLQVARLGDGNARHLVGTFSTVPAPPCLDSRRSDPSRRPDRLWHRANDLLAIMRARDAALGGDLFADHAWRLLLCVYVAEAESRIVTAASLAPRLGVSCDSVLRWVRVLQARSLIEPPDAVFGALQLTTTGIDGIERLLARQTTPEISLADR